MNLEKLTSGVLKATEEAAAFLRTQSMKVSAADVTVKSANNFVTYVDRQSEEMLINRLGALLPGSGFIAEESLPAGNQELAWIIDPLDGTTNYIHGIPLYCISIGLLEQNRLILGVVYEVNRKECFYTWKNAPSFLNGSQIRVSAQTSVQDSLFATGFPFYDYKWLDEYITLFKHLMQFSRGVRRLGSAAADLAWAACGRFDGFYEYGLSPWDVAGGALLVQNAGGTVTDFSGGENFIFGKEIIATNPLIHRELLEHFLSWKKQAHLE